MSPGRAGWHLSACCWLLPLAVACVQPRVRSIVGPSGQPTLFVSCAESGECYELSGKHCPSGYNIQRARGATPESYLVSCRQAPAAQAYYPTAPAPRPVPVPAPTLTTPRPAQPGADGSWPPSAESVDPPHPWAQHAPPPPPPPPPAPADTGHDVASGLSFPRPIGAEDLDLGY